MKNKKVNSVYAKLADVQWGKMKIEKSGKNTFAKYDYKKFGDIKAALMEKFREHKLLVTPTGEIRDLIVGNVVSYRRDMALIDASTGDQIVMESLFVGKNTDPDKASGSAITYGLKYFFNLLGLIPDESLDPDDDKTYGKVKAMSKPAPKAPVELAQGSLNLRMKSILEKPEMRNNLYGMLEAKDANDAKDKFMKLPVGDRNNLLDIIEGIR